MRSISATDAKQRLAALLDAAQREPIMIRRHDRDVAVLISAEEYERLLDARAEDFQRFCDMVGAGAREKGMDAAKLAALMADEES